MKGYKKLGFTFVEMAVSLTVFSIVSVAIFSGVMQIGKSIERSRECVSARQDLTVFCQTLYSYFNKSLRAYFWDTTTNSEMDYLTRFPTLPASSPMLNTLYLDKSSGTSASLVYNPTQHTIRWLRNANVTGDIILDNVYCWDYQNDANPGGQPVFKFPHRDDLYRSSTNPNFVVIQFRKMVSAPTSINPTPVTIPIRLMLQLNTTN